MSVFEVITCQKLACVVSVGHNLIKVRLVLNRFHGWQWSEILIRNVNPQAEDVEVLPINFFDGVDDSNGELILNPIRNEDVDTQRKDLDAVKGLDDLDVDAKPDKDAFAVQYGLGPPCHFGVEVARQIVF